MTERPEKSLRELLGTRTERLIEALAVDNIHTWSELKNTTGFSDRELRYHLAQLYSKKMLTRRGSLYYLVSGVADVYSNIDHRREEQTRRGKRRESTREPKYVYTLPSRNPKEAGAKRKKLRGE